MIQLHLERDPALVTSTTLRIRTRRYELFIWRSGRRLRFHRQPRW